MDAVLFTDVMAHLVSRLTTGLSTTSYSHARVSVLADDSPTQVILRRDGGNRASKTVMTSVVGVTIYASNYAEAEGLANMTAALFDALPDGNPVVVVDVQADISDVSDASGQRRFLRFAVSHRGGNL